MATWLESLRPGDRVGLRKRRGGRGHEATIIRITPTQIVARLSVLEIRFNRRTGVERGSNKPFVLCRTKEQVDQRLAELYPAEQARKDEGDERNITRQG